MQWVKTFLDCYTLYFFLGFIPKVYISLSFQSLFRPLPPSVITFTACEKKKRLKKSGLKKPEKKGAKKKKKKKGRKKNKTDKKVYPPEKPANKKRMKKKEKKTATKKGKTAKKKQKKKTDEKKVPRSFTNFFIRYRYRFYMTITPFTIIFNCDKKNRNKYWALHKQTSGRTALFQNVDFLMANNSKHCERQIVYRPNHPYCLLCHLHPESSSHLL